jgi:hypothetical protein
MSLRMNLRYAGAAALLAMCAAVPAVYAHATTLAVSARGEQISMSGELAQAPVCRVLRSDANTLELAFDLRGLNVRPVKTRGGEFVAIDWPNAPIDGAVGAPALPVLRQIFVAPDGADVSLGSIRLDAARSAAIDQPIVPVQAPVEKLPGALENAPFAFDADAYRADSTDAVTITPLGTVRGESLYMVEFRPVAYDAAAGTIAVTDQMQVRIDFRNHDTVPQRMTEMPGLDDIVINPDQLHGLRQGGAGNYLAVIASTYEAGVQGFLDVKEDQGYTVYQHVVSPGTSASAIKTYIEGLWGTADAPDYLLLVGDTDTIPAWTGGGTGSPKTDLNYACMDGTGDWYPDIAYGRFSVRNGTHLADVIEKTLVVEEGPHADPGYTLRAVFMASVDNYNISEGTHNYVIDTHLDPAGFDCDKLYQVTYGADTQDVRDSFNEGQIYGIYSGHGGNNSWADGPPFSQSDVNNLTNEGMYSLVWSFACVTGAYTDTECFMETWLRAGDKGAAIAIGSSVNSYWTEDDVLERVLFDIIYDTGVREVGPCWNATRMEYLAQMGSGSTTRRYFEMYNIMGDPSLFIPLPGGDLDMGVFPYSGMYAEGQSGGPFVPDEFVYTIENRLDIPCQYEVTDDASWITLSNATGMIPEGGSVDVTVTINSSANMLPDGEHVGTVTFYQPHHRRWHHRSRPHPQGRRPHPRLHVRPLIRPRLDDRGPLGLRLPDRRRRAVRQRRSHQRPQRPQLLRLQPQR